MKRALVFLGTLILAVIGGLVAFRMRDAQASTSLPSATAKKGEFLVLVRCRGELKARRSVQITAPVNVPELKIVWMAPGGSVVKAGEPILRFDPSSAKRQLDEKRALLTQAQASLDQALAQANVNAEQDKLDLAETVYQVEKAKLEAVKAEIKSKLDGEESRIDLGMAEKKSQVQTAKVELNRVSDEAKVASMRRNRDKAKDEVELTEFRLSQMELKAPAGGMIQFMPNFANGWMNASPFKVGDSVWSGAAVAELPDLDSMEMEAKVEEIDRGRVRVDQDVRIRVDSLPEMTFSARLHQMSPMTVMSFEWPPVRTFRASARLEKPDGRIRPSMNGSMDVIVERLPAAISIPAKALFNQNGKPVVYVASGGGYRPHPVEVLARNPDEIAIKGLKEGEQVALIEPDKAGDNSQPAAGQKQEKKS